jgi:hypothetical protein
LPSPTAQELKANAIKTSPHTADIKDFISFPSFYMQQYTKHAHNTKHAQGIYKK